MPDLVNPPPPAAAPVAADLPLALDRWPELEARLGGRRLVIFLDYDGTLSPIAPRPELAVLAADMREVLRRLAARGPVAILSGRGREDVAALVGLPELTYAGSHGFDIAGPPAAPGEPPLRHEAAPDAPAQMEALAASLAGDLDGIPGALVENKRFSVAIHFRLVADQDLPRLEAAVARAAANPAFGTLRRTGGKKVFELRPDLDWDKGKALAWLYHRWGLIGSGAVPIYIGDDATDEDAFAAVATLGRGGSETAGGSTQDGQGGSGQAEAGGSTQDGQGGSGQEAAGGSTQDGQGGSGQAEAGGSTQRGGGGADGIGFLVADSPRPTAATFRLQDPVEVYQLLRCLEELPAPPQAGEPPAAQTIGVADALAADWQAGQLHILGPLEVPGLAARHVRVYLPSSWTAEEPHFALYLFDGQNIFDDAPSFSGGWHLHKAIEKLVCATRRVPIVVGIDHGGEARLGELSPFPVQGHPGRVDVLLDWLTASLMPRLADQMNLVGTPLGAVVGGSSLGGLAAFYAHFRHHESFGGTLVMSPSFWVDDFAILPWVEDHPTPEVSRIYLDCGVREGRGTVLPQVAAVAGHLAARGYDPDHLMFRADPRGAHSESNWRRRLPRALRFFYRISR